MTRLARVTPVVLVMATSLGGAACRRQQAPPIPPPRAASAARLREGRLAEMRNAIMAPIYFEYDSDALTDQARSTLDAKLPILSSNAAMRIRISGHTDERGADEYNL